MSLFDLFDDDATDPYSKAIGTYFKKKTLHDIGENLADGLFESGEEKLQRQNAELDIKMKRRALGLPMSDEDYEDATNENRPFHTAGVVAAFGRHASPYVPEPGFLQPSRLFDEGVKMRISTGGVLGKTGSGWISSMADTNLLGKRVKNVSKLGSAIGRIFGRG